MNLSPRLRVLVGAVTTVMFLTIGWSVLTSGQRIGGAILLGLGIFRGVMLIRQASSAFASDP